jgi:hypothetical protein
MIITVSLIYTLCRSLQLQHTQSLLFNTLYSTCSTVLAFSYHVTVSKHLINIKHDFGLSRWSSLNQIMKICCWTVQTHHLFSYLCNQSVAVGALPEWLKVNLLCKRGEKSCISDYWPISLLMRISKIVENIIHKRESNIWNWNNTLAGEQFGFMKDLSTDKALLNFTD